MSSVTKPSARIADGHGHLLILATVSLLAGAAAGLIGALFRICLLKADDWRNALLASASNWSVAGFLLVVTVCAVSTAVAAWLVRRLCPFASGSGIPHVEAVLHEELQPAPLALV